VYSQSRYLGATGYQGDPQQGVRETDTYRYGASLTGSLFNEALDYSLSGYYSQRKRHVSGQDMFVERMAFALDGLGGPNCNPTTGTPGVGGCQFYNPFSNAIQRSVLNGVVNPDFNPALANSPELVRWLVGKQASFATNELFVIDAVVSGETSFSLGGGPISFAVGGQTRNEKYDLSLNDATNVDVFPCAFNNPRSVALGNVSQADFDRCQAGLTSATGPFAFLSGTTEERNSRTIYAVFGELALPFSDTLDVQAAIRFEDYGGDVGSSIDPKLAVRWQALDWLAFRGSISTTFRGPPQSFLSGTATSLIFIVPANAFKAVDVIGNPNLKPETALARNFGFIIDAGGFYASVDYWRFDFEDPLQTESSGQIVTAYAALGCQNGGAGAATADCAFLRSHVFPTGVTAALLERVDTNFINGGDITTSGVDFFVQYDFEDAVLGGELSLGAEATYTIEFDSANFTDINGFVLAPGGDFVGLLNDTVPFPSKPQVKGALFARYVNGSHRLTNYVRYTDDYTDSVPPPANTFPAGSNPRDFSRIDSHITWDMTYSVGLLDEKLNLSATLVNILDNDPPRTAQDLNYDPFTHNPLGRTIKVGFSYTLGGE
jgi:iron complex outermembrane receptor protein